MFFLIHFKTTVQTTVKLYGIYPFIELFIVILLAVICILANKSPIIFTKGTDLYRVLRAEEDPSIGLIAKDPSAKKTVLSHVNCGSRNNYTSQYISTTASLDVAREWVEKTYEKTGVRPRIGVIKRWQIPYGTKVIDLTIEANRDSYLGNAVCKNFAKASQEVLLVNRKAIPFKIYSPESTRHYLDFDLTSKSFIRGGMDVNQFLKNISFFNL